MYLVMPLQLQPNMFNATNLNSHALTNPIRVLEETYLVMTEANDDVAHLLDLLNWMVSRGIYTLTAGVTDGIAHFTSQFSLDPFQLMTNFDNTEEKTIVPILNKAKVELLNIGASEVEFTLTRTSDYLDVDFEDMNDEVEYIDIAITYLVK